MMPIPAAYIMRFLSNGPDFKQEESLWRVEDNTGCIYVPYIRRYAMYRQSVKGRIDFMLGRYQLGDLSGALVIDIGAHVGEFAMAAAPYASKIISFEPDPVARKALMRNIDNLDNVEVRPIALSDKTGKAKFYLATAHADSSLFEPEKFSEAIEVEALRLDDLDIDVTGYSRVVLKMDAEGFEPEVLQGGINWLKNLEVASIDVAPERADSDTYTEVKILLEGIGMRCRTYTSDQVLVMEKVK